MKMKGILLGIFLSLASIVSIFLLFAAATGFVKVPVLNTLLGTDKPRDLGVRSDPAAFDRMLERNGVELTATKGKYCLECPITYSETGPMDVTVSSVELTSFLQATNNEQGSIEDVQVKLGNNNSMEASATVDLKKYGYDYSGPVYAKGAIEKSGTGRIRLRLEKGEAGIVPIPGEYAQKGSQALEDAINGQLARMPGFSIDELEIKEGILHYKGLFPKKASA